MWAVSGVDSLHIEKICKILKICRLIFNFLTHNKFTISKPNKNLRQLSCRTVTKLSWIFVWEGFFVISVPLPYSPKNYGLSVICEIFHSKVSIAMIHFHLVIDFMPIKCICNTYRGPQKCIFLEF